MNNGKCFKCGKIRYCHSIGDGIYGLNAPYLCMDCKKSWEEYYMGYVNNNVKSVTIRMWKYWFERWAGKRVKNIEPLRRFIFR